MYCKQSYRESQIDGNIVNVDDVIIFKLKLRGAGALRYPSPLTMTVPVYLQIQSRHLIRIARWPGTLYLYF